MKAVVSGILTVKDESETKREKHGERMQSYICPLKFPQPTSQQRDYNMPNSNESLPKIFQVLFFFPLGKWLVIL